MFRIIFIAIGAIAAFAYAPKINAQVTAVKGQVQQFAQNPAESVKKLLPSLQRSETDTAQIEKMNKLENKEVKTEEKIVAFDTVTTEQSMANSLDNKQVAANYYVDERVQ